MKNNVRLSLSCALCLSIFAVGVEKTLKGQLAEINPPKIQKPLVSQEYLVDLKKLTERYTALEQNLKSCEEDFRNSPNVHTADIALRAALQTLEQTRTESKTMYDLSLALINTVCTLIGESTSLSDEQKKSYCEKTAHKLITFSKKISEEIRQVNELLKELEIIETKSEPKATIVDDLLATAQKFSDRARQELPVAPAAVTTTSERLPLTPPSSPKKSEEKLDVPPTTDENRLAQLLAALLIPPLPAAATTIELKLTGPKIVRGVNGVPSTPDSQTHELNS